MPSPFPTRDGRAGAGPAVFPQTKFHRPSGRDEHVERSLLLDAIAASRARIVVVTAPAGFGKSTLLAQWSACCAEPERVAWVSLDADDGGARLWSAVLTGLRELLGSDLDAALDAADAPDADLRSGVLIALLDALAATGDPVTLVLDDLHLALQDDATRDSLDWVLARLPSPHRVLLASRRELGLPSLGRLRIQGDVLDLRADDLRFADDEALRFLRDRLGLALDPADVAALEQRTEGWPAALYLAALRLRLGDEVGEVMEQLASSGEDLFGALTDEVLRSSPDHERRFILETSVLDRFNADLCARVLGDDATTRGAFRTLTRTSLLLSPLDRGRTWFRCHHLLRDVLHQRLVGDDPARARELHVRAGAWFETEGGESELHEAMHHYLAAQEWDLASELLTRHSIQFVQSGALGGRARDWLARFPAEVVRGDARLCYVSALLASLDGDRARRDAWLAAGESAGWEGPMPDGTASLRLAGLCLEAMICFDDLSGALAAAHEALAVLPSGSPLRSAVQALSAWHAHLLGDAGQAESLARQALAGQVHLPSSGLPLVAYLPVAVLALCACERGELEIAAGFVRDAVLARDAGPLRGAPHSLPVTCASARLLTLRGGAEEAVARCTAGLELARDWRDSSLMVPAALLELARAQHAAGRPSEADAAARAGRARLAGARDAGALPAALEAFELPGAGAGAGASGAARPARARRANAAPSSTGGAGGGEQLSAREVEVLRAIAGPGSLREVADALYISRNTIKTHTRALYAKLGAGTRDEAVSRGRELGLLADGLGGTREDSP
ncbi:MAG TPA: AAA family ATPase [Solirubrobacteraceae bacterium]|jgi:LuxR family maltose regulon positive regulatory protein|nr:AAA family ATPase [Solirubrobacteraceae bacterium]